MLKCLTRNKGNILLFYYQFIWQSAFPCKKKILNLSVNSTQTLNSFSDIREY